MVAEFGSCEQVDGHLVVLHRARAGVAYATRAEAEASEEHFDGKTTE